MHLVLLVILGASGGLAVGTGLLALYSIIDFSSMLRNDSTDPNFAHRLELSIAVGCLVSALCHFFDLGISAPKAIIAFVGLMFGSFVGLLTASLSDVIGILPIIDIKSKGRISLPLVAASLTIGRVAGSMYYFSTR
ncbi:MAG: stage V sporulation protein AB [Eubacteriaceae bacterium]|nr:stage V sporulation protein AB [Eubacteriaceae bacterium]